MKKDIKKIDIETAGVMQLSIFMAETKVNTPMGLKAGKPQVGIELTENGRKRYAFLSLDNAKTLQDQLARLIASALG